MNKDVKETSLENLSKAIMAQRIFHGYIIEVDREEDKEPLVKEILKAMLCEKEIGKGCKRCRVCQKIEHGNYGDLYEVKSDIGKNILVKQIEGLQRNLKRVPIDGKYKFAVIYQGDTIQEQAQNKLLKTLEEPDEHTVIIILCKNRDNLLQTVKSRCQLINARGFGENLEGVNSQVYELYSMMRENKFFYKVKDNLDSIAKSREEALVFLDDLEKIIGERLMKESIIKIDYEIKVIEAGRRDILKNMNYKYVLRSIALKIGG